ncbi:FAD/NAD(P)-binding protein [Uliginosibacterium sp. 31-16]|uniref:FAD/NAD(P)-binding protein n=1 Tax=Uliginosibacterium sp. 31-16 TaxID=3068315 RepID=UPI00273FD2D7|nr:FAD/NAD(P)-binding protein [Uliginosibacterium sp. 31-16]MDP5240043.1 FAD/NAD(P)-binding protein [Uliginosibacterium sp. 31-16]
MKTDNAYLPWEAEIVDTIQETPDIFTWKLRFTDREVARNYSFKHGQFNMLYLYGVGEVAISVMSNDGECIYHTIRAVGRITKAMMKLPIGAHIGVRGPFGSAWPLDEARGKDVVFVTAGLGCAPVTSSIKYVVANRAAYGRLVIMQSVRHRNEGLWEPQYDEWRTLPDTQVLLTASRDKTRWPHWSLGRVSVLLDEAQYDKQNCVVMMCGPDAMMADTARTLVELGVPAESLFVSLERNMQCAVGHCGHCQLGGKFVCKDGPIFVWPQVAELMRVKGY